MTDDNIREAAIEFAKKNKNRIAKELTDTSKYVPDSIPISVFMAGSPGAGKTEFSKYLIMLLENESERRAIRIDGDEIRRFIPGYTGNNSHLFQRAVSIIIEKIHDHVLHQKQSFIFDGTFSNYDKASQNINRSLAKGHHVYIFYIYQKPEVAWRFTQAREKVEGRNIHKEAFIKEFLGSKEVIGRISKEFGDKVTIFFVKKDFEKNTVENIVKIDSNSNRIDEYAKEYYTVDTLNIIL